MQDNHRDTVIRNIPKLLHLLEYQLLVDYLRDGRVLSRIMIKQIEKDYANEDTKLERLLRKLTKRGPTAFRILCEACQTLEFIDALNILHPGQLYFNRHADANGLSMTKNIPRMNQNREELAPYVGYVPENPNLIVTKSQEFHIHPTALTYEMKSKNRGVLFLVNIINFTRTDDRDGAGVDRDSLIWVFRQMGFVIFYYEDILWKELERLLDQLRKSKYLQVADCFVFGIMTHGSNTNHKEMVLFPDEGEVVIDVIINKFSNLECKPLLLKPKIFLLPYCRGDHPDTGMAPPTYHESTSIQGTFSPSSSNGRSEGRNETLSGVQTDGESSFFRVPTKSDIMLCYGTVRGFQTFREGGTGSWFVEALCNNLAKHAHNTDFDTLMKMVTHDIRTQETKEQKKQTPCTESWGFSRVLYFNPGFYDSKS